MPGYHLKTIAPGDYGHSDKILEEVQELMDAEDQDNRIMMLCELADIVGAVKGYLHMHLPGFRLEDLDRMAQATERAFKDGTRKSK